VVTSAIAEPRYIAFELPTTLFGASIVIVIDCADLSFGLTSIWMARYECYLLADAASDVGYGVRRHFFLMLV
jgi:hypothetical protein